MTLFFKQIKIKDVEFSEFLTMKQISTPGLKSKWPIRTRSGKMSPVLWVRVTAHSYLWHSGKAGVLETDTLPHTSTMLWSDLDEFILNPLEKATWY